MAVYVLCRNAQLNLTIFTMSCMCIVMPLSICQLPDCNLFTQHALSYGRDTSSELWTPVQFSLLKYNLLQYLCFTVFFANIFHSIRLILCYSKPVRLTTSLFRWDKVLGLCCAGSALAPESLVLRRITFRDHQPSTCFLAPTGSIKPWFHTEGNLLLYASYLPLGVPNGRVHLRVSGCCKGASMAWRFRRAKGQAKDG